MINITRISKYSSIILIGKDIGIDITDKKIIQIVSPDDCSLFICEYIPKENLELYYSEQSADINSKKIEPVKSKEEIELENALDTQLNHDPLGRYSGCNLREIFENGDKDWIIWALNNMRNKYILDKVKLIYDKNYADIKSAE